MGIKDKVLNKAKSYMSDKNYDFNLIGESKISMKPIEEEEVLKKFT